MTMKIKTIETGETHELTLIDPKSGICWIRDLMGNHDATPEFDDESGIWLMEKEDFEWWSDLAERYQAADDRYHELCQSLDDPDPLMEAAAHINCDLEDHPERLQEICDEYQKGTEP